MLMPDCYTYAEMDAVINSYPLLPFSNFDEFIRLLESNKKGVIRKETKKAKTNVGIATATRHDAKVCFAIMFQFGDEEEKKPVGNQEKWVVNLLR